MSRYDDILAAIEARLAQIRTAGGYRTEAGARVFRDLEYQLAPPEKPCLILFPGGLSDSLDGDPAPSQGEENHTLSLHIEGFIADDARGSESERLRQDILQALKADQFFGGLTEGFEGSITSDARVEDAGDDGLLGVVEVDATVFYVTLYGEG